MKILHCPTSTGGHPWGLSRAERRLGQTSFSACFHQDYLGFPADLFIYNKEESKLVQQLKCWKFLLSEAKKFDIIHYNFGLGLLPWGFSAKWVGMPGPAGIFFRMYGALCSAAEAFILKEKVIAVTFQGDDARQGDWCVQNLLHSIAHHDQGNYYSTLQNELNREKIRRFEKKADLIYAVNPDLLRVLPSRSKFLPYAHLEPKKFKVSENQSKIRPLVVHAPTHRKAKGTEFILKAVDRLKHEGTKFDFRLVEGLSNEQARKIYAEADLIIDQLLVGWYGGFAVEAMAMGKPVVCFIRKEDLKLIPLAMADDLPFIEAEPSSIYEVLKKWLTKRKNDLAERGRKSRKFVEHWHDPDQIASGVIKDYQAVQKSKTAESLRRR